MDSSKRSFLGTLAAVGIGNSVFARALAAETKENIGLVDVVSIARAEWVAGITLTEKDRNSLLTGLKNSRQGLQQLRGHVLTNADAPALQFAAVAAQPAETGPRGSVKLSAERQPIGKPKDANVMAMLGVGDLSELIRTRQITPTELTKLYLERLKAHGPLLECVVTLTEDVAMKQAADADAEINAGRYRGPLHGIPWGAKDLISHPDYPTTWGAPQYREQRFTNKATLVQKLEEAGAVLVAKLSLGALAMGDKWFGGETRNPWNPKEGSSGSSAGSASATAAGLVGFAIGSETLGSIVSPCRQCSVAGLRPTFGRISRHGCMALCWSMDKIGPIVRRIEDAALILGAIHGADGKDETAVTRPFSWPGEKKPTAWRIGIRDGDEKRHPRAFAIFRKLGATLIPVQLPKKFPIWPTAMITLEAETSEAFREITDLGITEGLNEWPEMLRLGRFATAADYLRAQRIRKLLMQEMNRCMENVDALFDPRHETLPLTNLTGHPCAVIALHSQPEFPESAQPEMISLIGHCFGETELLSVAHAAETAAGDWRRHPILK
jgi:Asp-tRNA(Asn)/Glu-tRNA(Gln) amidotransferase A subunit family amidase